MSVRKNLAQVALTMYHLHLRRMSTAEEVSSCFGSKKMKKNCLGVKHIFCLKANSCFNYIDPVAHRILKSFSCVSQKKTFGKKSVHVQRVLWLDHFMRVA